jgi:gamma-glutamyltranspeptidase/glutathione hydrolase
VVASVATLLPLTLIAPQAHAGGAFSAKTGDDRGWHGRPTSLPKVPLMVGAGGAVSSVDRDASQVGIDMLARGGNAADAAIATAAALGVTEPYSTGIGGGGFLVYYDAATKQVSTIDGRETAPSTFTKDTFVADGKAMDFNTVVRSGLSVGVPGTPALWDKALRDFGTRSLNDALKPAEALALKGFVVDQTFHDQTADNATRFAMFPETARVFLPGGAPPAVGSTFTNPDMARAYRLLRTQGVDVLYGGRLGQALVDEVEHPTTAPGVSVMSGEMTMADLQAYEALRRAPIHSTYKGHDVYGMPVPSSGGIAVAEILNLMSAYEDRTGVETGALSDLDYLHRFSEASATAFADRNRYVGRQRDHRARLRVPAQQRADRLQLRSRRPGARPQPPRAGQAPALVDEPDDRAEGRCAVPRGRVAGRRDDHHVRLPDAPRLPRSGPPAGRRHRRRAAVLAQRHGGGRAADLRRPPRHRAHGLGPQALQGG